MQARDALPLLSGIDWTPIVVALITLSGVLFNGMMGLFIWSHVRTPSKASIGKQVESTHLNTIAGNWLLQEIAAVHGLTPQAMPAPPEGDAADADR